LHFLFRDVERQVEVELEGDDRAPPELVDDICFKPGICPNWRSSGAVIDDVVTSARARIQGDNLIVG
jgi:hypothetical protein